MKTQMRFQKILTIITLVLAALTFVLGLGFCMGVIGASRDYTSEERKDIYWPFEGDFKKETNNDIIKADALYEYSQNANNIIVIMAIILVLMVALLYITNCNKRRNYYVTNYVAIGLYIAYAVVFTIVFLVLIGGCFARVNMIDFAKWKEVMAVTDKDRYGVVTYKNGTEYSESCITLILGIVDCVIILADCVAWILNIVWKIKLMKGEKALLEQGFVKEVA